MRKLNFSKNIFPNSATALNVFCGFVSIIYSSQNDFKMAAIFIFSAAFFDLLDGIIARLTRTSSSFGVELDSLADVVSFGVAPSFLIYKSFLIQYDILGILLSSLILLFGAFRLARFNIQLDDISTKLDFKGLPVPIAAIFIASIILFYHNSINIVKPFASLIIPSILILSFLMVSNIRYNTLPKVKYLNTFGKIALFTLSFGALAAIIITEGIAFFYLVSAHIVFGIGRHVLLLITEDRDNTEIKLNEK